VQEAVRGEGDCATHTWLAAAQSAAGSTRAEKGAPPTACGAKIEELPRAVAPRLVADDHASAAEKVPLLCA
jgi:hypothetical protein